MNESKRNNLSVTKDTESPLIIASDKAGIGAEDTVRWLLEFGQGDLSKLSTELYDFLKYTLLAFALTGSSHPKIRRSSLELQFRDNPILPTLTREEVGRWQVAISSLINIIFAHDVTKFQIKPIPMLFMSPGPIVMKMRMHKGMSEHKARKPFLIPSHENIESSFQYYAALLLLDHADWLRQCRDCQTIFLAGKRNQTFCGDNCRGRWNTRRVRKTKPERYWKRGRPPEVKVSPTKKRGGPRHGKKKRH